MLTILHKIVRDTLAKVLNLEKAKKSDQGVKLGHSVCCLSLPHDRVVWDTPSCAQTLNLRSNFLMT